MIIIENVIKFVLEVCFYLDSLLNKTKEDVDGAIVEQEENDNHHLIDEDIYKTSK